MINKIILSVLVVLALGVFIFFLNVPIGLNGLNSNNVDDGRVKVTASFYPLAFFAEQIGGERADVYNITPAGAEPHEYELTAQDIIRIQNSDLLLINGGGLEPWARNISRNIDSDKTKIVNVGERFISLEGVEDGHGDEEEEEHEEEGDEHEDEMDPHVWLSPVLTSEMVDIILESFIEVDDANSSFYEANATNLKNELVTLDEEFRLGLSTCAKGAIVTSHAAFAYLALEYDFEQVAITGLSPEAEPSAREFAEIAEFAKDNDIGHIFFESLVSPRLAEALANEIGAETLVLNPLEGLTQQELRNGKDYFSEMRGNLINLQTALQCQKKN